MCLDALNLNRYGPKIAISIDVQGEFMWLTAILLSTALFAGDPNDLSTRKSDKNEGSYLPIKSPHADVGLPEALSDQQKKELLIVIYALENQGADPDTIRKLKENYFELTLSHYRFDIIDLGIANDSEIKKAATDSKNINDGETAGN